MAATALTGLLQPSLQLIGGPSACKEVPPPPAGQNSCPDPQPLPSTSPPHNVPVLTAQPHRTVELARALLKGSLPGEGLYCSPGLTPVIPAGPQLSAPSTSRVSGQNAVMAGSVHSAVGGADLGDFAVGRHVQPVLKQRIRQVSLDGGKRRRRAKLCGPSPSPAQPAHTGLW